MASLIAHLYQTERGAGRDNGSKVLNTAASRPQAMVWPRNVRGTRMIKNDRAPSATHECQVVTRRHRCGPSDLDHLGARAVIAKQELVSRPEPSHQQEGTRSITCITR